MSASAAANGGQFEGPGGVYLVDAVAHNAIGYYRTEEEALRDVADIVAENGRDSAEARNLLMYQDGSDDAGIAGDALIARALERARLPEPRTAG